MLALMLVVEAFTVRWAARSVTFMFGLTVAVAVGAARVCLGVHWVTDVAARWFLSAAWFVATAFVVRRLFGRGSVHRRFRRRTRPELASHLLLHQVVEAPWPGG